MKRTAISIVYLAAGGLALWTQSANVLASGSAPSMPPMYHPMKEGAAGAMFAVMRNTANSPLKGSESDKDHYSIGDKLVFSTPLYSDKDLATPVATFYGETTVLKGGTFADMLTMLHFDCVFLNGDHLTGQGIVNWTGTEDAAITGGTGAYDGARGTMHHSLGKDNIFTYTVFLKH